MTEKIWDDKFGMIEVVDKMGFSYVDNKKTAIIDGVGADAEIITNANGGKQSKSPMAMHLVDPKFLSLTCADILLDLEYIDEFGNSKRADEDIVVYNCCKAMEHIANYMQKGSKYSLVLAMGALECEDLQQLIRISKVLQYGVERYEANNWRLIPEEEHINHALIHLVAAVAGDTQDEHVDHALCRLMMAYATEKSENFNYNLYIKRNS